MDEHAGKYIKVIASEAKQSSLFHSGSSIAAPHEVRLAMTVLCAVSQEASTRFEPVEGLAMTIRFQLARREMGSRSVAANAK